MRAANEPRERSERAKPRASERVGGSGGAKPFGKMIDTHQHYWRYDAAEYAWIDDSMSTLQRDFLPPDGKREMDAAGVTACIAVQARQTLDETHALLDLADRYPFITGVVGWIDLQAGDVARQLAEFADVRRSSASGTSSRRSRTASWRARSSARESRSSNRLAWRTTSSCTPGSFRTPWRLRARFRASASCWIISASRISVGAVSRRGAGTSSTLAALPNVACKLSGLVTEADWRSWTPGQLRPYLDAALEAFGPSRLMLGTDWPVCTVAATYLAAIDLVREAIADYSADERRQILAGHGGKRVPRESGTPTMKRLLLLALLLASTACGSAPDGNTPGGITIAVIPKGTSHVFWQSIHAGAEKAAPELGVTIIWRGPLREDDRDAQVSEVEGFVSRGVSGIVPRAARRHGARAAGRGSGAAEDSRS